MRCFLKIFKFFDSIRIKRNMIKKFEKTLGYSPDLKNPKSYCEKIQWLKFNNSYDKKVIERADKFRVRDYINEKGFGDNLVELYGSWDKVEDVSWSDLPRKFVFKINNGSGSQYNWFVEDIATFDKEQFVRDVEKITQEDYGYEDGEFHYKEMPTKILAEQYLEDNGEPIKDYKFYCFNGKVTFIIVESGVNFGPYVLDIYDTKWSRSKIDLFKKFSRPDNPYEKPKNLNDMISMAESLSKGYPLIRVDLYNVNERIYFGELTYTPGNGLARWKPKSLDFELGKLISLDKINH